MLWFGCSRFFFWSPILSGYFLWLRGSFQVCQIQLVLQTSSWSTAFSVLWQDLISCLSFSFLLFSVRWNGKIDEITSYFLRVITIGLIYSYRFSFGRHYSQVLICYQKPSWSLFPFSWAKLCFPFHYFNFVFHIYNHDTYTHYSSRYYQCFECLTPDIAGGLSLVSVWAQYFSAHKNSSEYSGRSLLCCYLSTSIFFQASCDLFKCTNYNDNHRHPHLLQFL